MYFYLYPSDELSLFQLSFIVRSSFLILLHHCLRVEGVGIPLSCLTPPYSLCMCLSQGRSLWFSGCRLLMCYMFVFRLFLIRPLVFSFELFYICHFGAFYSLLFGMGLLIVEGRTVTYIFFLISVSFGLLWSGELSHSQSYRIFFYRIKIFNLFLCLIRRHITVEIRFQLGFT